MLRTSVLKKWGTKVVVQPWGQKVPVSGRAGLANIPEELTYKTQYQTDVPRLIKKVGKTRSSKFLKLSLGSTQRQN